MVAIAGDQPVRERLAVARARGGRTGAAGTTACRNAIFTAAR